MEGDAINMSALTKKDQEAFNTIVDVISGVSPLIQHFGDSMEKGDYARAYEVAVNLRTFIDRKLPAIEGTALNSGAMKPAVLDLGRGLDDLRSGTIETIKWIEEYNALKVKIKPIAERVGSATSHINKSVTFTRAMAENEKSHKKKK